MHQRRSSPSPADAADIAAEAFVFGYPLVLSDRVRAWMTDVPEPDSVHMKAPLNGFVHARRVPDASSARAAGPHADTLRSSAWLDLSHGPLLLTVPETRGRFFSLTLVDAWTNAFASVGARTTGTRGGTFALLGPGTPWAATPITAPVIAAPTRWVRIAGLTQVDGHADAAAAHATQDGYRLAPARRPDAGGVVVDPARRGRTPPVAQVERLDGHAFFAELTRLMRDNPPHGEDRVMVERMRRAGLLLERDEERSRRVPALREAIERGARRGLERVVAATEAPPGEPVGQWRIRFRLGAHGTDYARRAAAACSGLEAGPEGDDLPALLSSDADGQPLTGRHRYELRFRPGAPPPVHGFWTLTTYDDHLALVDNPADCYSVGDWNGLRFDADGSLPILIQHRRPPDVERANWLPAPPGRFNLMLRLVWPQDEVLNRHWAPPAVARVDRASG